jgi:hypothetical protein
MNKDDLLLYISFLLIIGSIIIFAYYSYVDKVNECTSDPIRYGVEEIRENYNADHVSGTMTVNINGSFKVWAFGDDNSLDYLSTLLES